MINMGAARPCSLARFQVPPLLGLVFPEKLLPLGFLT